MGIPAVGQKIANVPISNRYDHPDTFDSYEKVLVDFDWSHQFTENWAVRNSLVSLFYKEDWTEIDPIFLRPDNRTSEIWSWIGDRNNEQHNVTLDLTGKFDLLGSKHEILLGGDYYTYELSQSVSSVFVDTIDLFNPVFPSVDVAALKALPRDFGSYIVDSWYGLYFQDQITFWDKLHIMGGGRYDWAETTQGDGTSIDIAEANSTTIHEEFFSPRVGILYRPLHWLSLYGNYVESAGVNNGLSRDGSVFDPQTATQYEAGVKTEFLDGRLTSTLAFYHLTKENILTPDPLNPRFSIPIGEARSQGFEVDAAGQLADSLSLIGTYAYTDTEITKDNSGNEGNRLPIAPLHSGSVYLKYDLPRELLAGLSVGGGVYIAGKRWGDAANSYFDDAYARLDLFTAYRRQIGATAITARININNVTDTNYYILGSARCCNLPAEPLTVLGSIRLEF